MTQPPQVLLDHEYATLWHHPDERIIHHQFHKFTTGECFRQVLLVGLEALIKYGIHKWLSDDRGNAAVHPDDAEWTRSTWGPKMLAAGWAYWALVPPENAIGKMNMERWIQGAIQLGVTVSLFDDPDAAFAWLKEQ